MAHDESSNGKDPWKRDSDAPNDLDQIWQEWQRNLGRILGGGGGGAGASGGSGGYVLIIMRHVVFALVGYTNAGKSTLFNALTNARVYVKDQLFATLDPTVRRLDLPGDEHVILADTVGFVRDLPHELVAKS